MTAEPFDNLMLRVPEKYKRGLEKLAALEDEMANKLLEVVRNFPPTFHAKDIAALAKEQHGVEFEDSLDIIVTVLSLYSFRESEELPTNLIVERLTKALQGEKSLHFSDSYISRFQKRLHEFLEIRGSLEIVWKANDLRLESENIFLDSRVLTDIRPIFKSEVEEGVGGALVVHTLRVIYKSMDGSKEFFVALDSSDMEKLLEQVERALEKEQVLQSLLKKADVPYLSIYPSFEE